jgi:hypothetical protein
MSLVYRMAEDSAAARGEDVHSDELEVPLLSKVRRMLPGGVP